VRRAAIVGAAWAVAAACAGGSPPAAPDGADQPAILFIGNSLTSQNDLPRRCATVAAASGIAITTDSVAIGGASLLDQWNDGRARRAIASRRWMAVVLQQGPSTLPESREELTRSSALFGEEIRRAGARPALLMVWPLPGQQAAAVAASYRAAAEATDSVLIPAGEAWVRATAADPGLTLTVSDGYHPSPLGTELAALSVVCTLFPGSRPQPQIALPEAQRRQMATAACATPAASE
jgi:hypothetical protein